MSWTEGNIAQLRLAALWYGYGRNDAGQRVDAAAFAEYYANLATAFEDGGSFLPSVQDAWQQFTTNTLVPEGHDEAAQAADQTERTQP